MVTKDAFKSRTGCEITSVERLARTTSDGVGGDAPRLWQLARALRRPRRHPGAWKLRSPVGMKALDAVNDAFHDDYERIRDDAVADGPVIVVLADKLIAVRKGQRMEIEFTPRLFHVIKCAAHAPLAVYALLSAERQRPMAHDAKRRGEQLARHLADSLASLPPDAPRDCADDMRGLLESSLSFLQRALMSNGEATADVDAFARSTGDVLVRLTRHATRLQLTALDAAARRAVETMSPSERNTLQVVVTGDHQARARSLAMQYFQKRLREPEGSEERVTFAEDVTNERDALALVGTRRIDRAIALAFFGDAKRLQRDVLGDAARDLLNEVVSAQMATNREW